MVESIIEQIAAFESEQQWWAVMETCGHWLAHNPNNSYHPIADQVHKHFIRSLIEEGSFWLASLAYQLVREDSQELQIAADDMLCCVVVRNEAERLPYFLDYYRRQGITKFLIVDNDSSDETLAYLLAQPDVALWSSTYPINDANFGAAWFEVILSEYSAGHWVLFVDVDELFYYPKCDEIGLLHLCDDLTQQGAKAYCAIQLDMYSEKTISETKYNKGNDFLQACPYFDRQFYHLQIPFQGPYANQTGYFGGLRKRLRGECEWSYGLNKVPLIYYTPDSVLVGGQQATSYPSEDIATGRGCVLRFNAMAQCSGGAEAKASGQQHLAQSCNSNHTVRLSTAFTNEQATTFYDPTQSIRFRDSGQLVELGITQASMGQIQQSSDDSQAGVTKMMQAFVKLGEKWLAQCELRKACAHYQKVIDLNPQFVPAYHRLGYILQQDGQIDESLAVYEQAYVLAPNDVALEQIIRALKRRSA